MITDKSDDFIISRISSEILGLLSKETFFGYNLKRSNESKLRAISVTDVVRLTLLLHAIFVAKTATPKRYHMKRDIYYILKFCFSNESQMDRLLMFICKNFECPRHSLGIYSCSKGICIGPFSYKYRSEEWYSCLDRERIIPAQAVHTNGYAFASSKGISPAFILVVEKYCIFQQISQRKFQTEFNFILITGKGVPDLATRAWTKLLATSLGLQVFGLCDMNPYGCRLMSLYIMSPYSTGFWPEAKNYLISSMELLLLESKNTKIFKECLQQNLSPRDIVTCNTLLERFLTHKESSKENPSKYDSFIQMLRRIKQYKFKFELENIGADYFSQSWLPASLRKLHLKTSTSRKYKRAKLSTYSVTNIYGIRI